MIFTDKSRMLIATAAAGLTMQEIPADLWPEELRRAKAMPGLKSRPIKAWRSKTFLAVLYADRGARRLSVNRTTMSSTRPHRFEDGITWDELMRVKSECGLGDVWAVEIYPPNEEVVDVANMRHLWLLAAPPPYAWREEGKA